MEDKRLEIVGSEKHDRLARISLLFGTSVPTLNRCVFSTLMDPRMKRSFEAPKVFNKADFLKAATYSLTGRTVKASNVVKQTTLCDAARDIIVAYATTRVESVRAGLHKALKTLKAENAKVGKA